MIRNLLFALVLLPFTGAAQVQLGPLINSGQLPLLTDSIMPYTPYIDSSSAFMAGGFQVGDVVNDFILFDTASNPHQLSQILNTGRPVLLTTGSWSCPAYRYAMDQVIPDLVAMFGTQVVFMNVYQLEAHPDSPDVSPFTGTVYTTSQNVTDSVLLAQHRTYGDRRNVAIASMASLGAPCKLVLDGPGNEFWNAYGPSPNNAYLITRDGWVFNKYGWLSQSKPQAILDINMLLNTVGITEHHDASWLAPIANPGNENTVLTSVASKLCRVRVTDILGNIVLEQDLQPGASIALGAGLPSEGLYLVAILAEDHSEQFRFVKAR